MDTSKTPAISLGAFTLVEALVVIAIIGILIALLLPAVGGARESSRRAACANNLRQIAIAIKLHVEVHQVFPTGGWSGNWLGDPDAGYGIRQPGGWIYNILSYIEEEGLRQLGSRLVESERQHAQIRLMQSPLAVFIGPSRRPVGLYSYTGSGLRNAQAPSEVAKTDYAISTVISYEKSEVIPGEFQSHGRGFSKTMLAGEKSLDHTEYLRTNC